MKISLNVFIKSALSDLGHLYKEIPIFNINIVAEWDKSRRHQFVKNLYHARGHFDRQLFQRAALCSSSPRDKLKKLEDICDELGIEFEGRDGIQGLLSGEKTVLKIMKSHEQLFVDFSEDIGCGLGDEISRYSQPAYLHEYNESLMRLLANKDELIREVAFSAYELLDNIDYKELYTVAVTLGAGSKGLLFFEVHQHSNHFDKTSQSLEIFWEQDSEKCCQVFRKIFDLQTRMWNDLSLNIIKNEQ